MAWGRNKKTGSEYGITEGVIWQQILIFFFPILLGTFFQQLYNTADAVIVGKFVGKAALAAVGGTTGILINLVVGFFVGLSSGATVIISQFYGARKHLEVSQTVHTAAALALSGGVVLTVLGILVSPTALRWMGTPEDVMPMAVTYIRIYFCGMIPSLIYNIGSGILRAVGDSRRPLFFLICSCMTNIVLDVVLVLGFEMGVAGAALATILSQFLSAILVLLTLTRSPMSYQLHARQIRFHGSILKSIVRIGLPAGLQSVMYSVSNLIIQAAVNGFGTDVMAAWTSVGKIDGIFWMVINAFGISITTFVGQNFGAQKFDRMRKCIRVGFGMAAITTVLISTFALTCGSFVLRMFSTDPVVLEFGIDIIRLLAPTWITYIAIEILACAVRGCGDSFRPTLMTLVGVCMLRAVWVLAVAPRFNTLRMVAVCYPITWSVTSIMFLVYYLRGNWFRRCLKKAGFEAA